MIAADIRSEPQYSTEKENSLNQGKIVGYKVTRTFVLKVRDVTAFAKLVDELLNFGGVEFLGIDSGLSKEKEVVDEIFEKALANAREQAEKTLKTMGMKLDSIFAVSPVAFTEIQRRIFGSSAPTAETESALPAQGRNASDYRLAPITVSQSIRVIYLISPVK